MGGEKGVDRSSAEKIESEVSKEPPSGKRETQVFPETVRKPNQAGRGWEEKKSRESLKLLMNLAFRTLEGAIILGMAGNNQKKNL